MIGRLIGRLIGDMIDFIGSIWVLMSLAVVSRFRVKGRYWTWRTMTAFPEGKVPGGKMGFVRFGLEYARWAWRMRRLR